MAFRTLKTIVPVDPLIQHLVGNKPYSPDGAKKLWEALKALSGATVEISSDLVNEIAGNLEGGDDIFVNTVAAVDPDFNNNTPAAPTGKTNVVWQLSGDGAFISAHYNDPVLPVRPPGFGAGPIIGGKLDAITNFTLVTPMCQSSAAPPATVSNIGIWPIKGWIGSIAIALKDAMTNASLVRGGFGYVEGANNDWLYDMSIVPGSAAGAYGDGSQYLFVNEGLDLRGAFASSGITANTMSAWAAEFNTEDDSIPIMFSFFGNAAGATTYTSMAGVSGTTATESAHRTPLPACTIDHLYIRLLTAQGAGGSCVITFYKNGIATALSITVPAGAAALGVYVDFTNSITVAADDQISIEIVNNNGAGASCTGIVSYLIHPDGFTALYYGYYGDNEVSSPTTNYDMPFYSSGSHASGQTEGNRFFPSPRPFNIGDGALRLWLNAVSATCTCDWTVRKNGSDTAVTINIPTGASAGTVLKNSGTTADFAKLDRFTLSHNRGGAGASHVVGGWSIALV